MEKEFIPYEQALSLKELGFNEPCLLRVQYSSGKDVSSGKKFKNSIWLANGYEAEIKDKKIKYKFPKHSEQKYGELNIPLYQQAFRFFREKYMLKGEITHADSNGSQKFTIWKWNFDNNIGKWERIPNIGTFDSWESAELECLKKLIEIVKSNIDEY